VLLSDRALLGPADLHFDAPQSHSSATGRSGPGDASDAGLTLADLERRHIERVLRDVGGRVAEAAVRLDIPRSSLYQKIKALRIEVSKT
jgi:DNA-binding NtrC family response regulator